MNHSLSRTRSRGIALALAVAVTAGASLASIANPPSGTPLTIPVGGTVTITLKNAGGCHFDMTRMVTDSNVATASPDSGSDLTGVKIVVTGVGIGTTTLTITTNGGTCPPAVHTYPITVVANLGNMSKLFAAGLKTDLFELKADIKLDLKTWKTPYLTTLSDYGAGSITIDQALDQVHSHTDALVGRYYGYTWTALGSGADHGSALLQGNDVAVGDGPAGFFMGGCGIWDDFRGDVRTEVTKAFGTVKKTLKGYYGTLEKASGVQLAGSYHFPMLWKIEPLADDQVGAPTPKIETQVSNVSVQGTTNVSADNGRVIVSGIADSSLNPTIAVELVTFSVSGGTNTTVTSVPIGPNGQWTATFSNVTAGDHQVKVKFTGDKAEVGAIVYVPKG